MRTNVKQLHSYLQGSWQPGEGDDIALLDPTTDLDGVHPNDRGHSIIADELERQILNVLRSRRLFPCVDGAACDLDDLLPGLVPGGQPIGLGPMPGPGRP